jgi:hypothetical protein
MLMVYAPIHTVSRARDMTTRWLPITVGFYCAAVSF